MNHSPCLTTAVLVCTAALVLCACASGGDGVERRPKVALDKVVELADDLTLERWGERLWIHTTTKEIEGYGPFPANGLLLVGSSASVLIDTTYNPSQARMLMGWARDSLDRPIEAAIITHAHDDRIGGVEALLGEGVPVYGLPASAALARAQSVPGPDHPLAEDAVIELAGIELQTYFPGAAHAPDNVVVWIPGEGVLVGGCMVKSLDSGGLGYTADASITGWARAIEALKSRFRSPSLVVPGHGRPGGAELLDHTAALLDKAIAEP